MVAPAAISLLVIITMTMIPITSATAEIDYFEDFDYEIAAERLPLTLNIRASTQNESDEGVVSIATLSLYETRTGKNVTNITYAIELSKLDSTDLSNSTKPFLRDVFHTRQSTLVLALKQVDDNQSTLIENAYREQFLNAWVWNSTQGALTVTSSEIERNETYRLSISILGIDNVRDLLKPEDVPRVEFELDTALDTRAEASIIPGSIVSLQDQSDESLLSAAFSTEVEGFSFEIQLSWNKEDFVRVLSNDVGILEIQVWDGEPRGGKLMLKLPSAFVYLKGQGDSYQTVLGSLGVNPFGGNWEIIEKYSPSCETLVLTIAYDVSPGQRGRAYLTNFQLLGGSGEYRRPMGETITPTIALAEGNFTLHSISNAALCNFSLIKEEKTLHVDVEHSEHWKMAVPKGYLEVEIPHKLLGGNYTVFVDGNKTDDFSVNSGTNSTVMTIEYAPNARSMDIVGTTVIPEFGAFMIYALAIATLLLSFFALNPRMHLRERG